MPDLEVLPSPEIALDLMPSPEMALTVTSPAEISLTVQAVPAQTLTVDPPPSIDLTLVVGQGPAGPDLTSTYETISKNLRTADFELVWDDGVLTEMLYEDGVRKVFGYAPSGELASITIYDAMDAVIGTKTLNYTAGDLVNVVYT